MKNDMKRTASADWSRTCEGCRHVVVEPGGRREVVFKCFAPGERCGYTVGVNHFYPYVPAWCPEMEKK